MSINAALIKKLLPMTMIGVGLMLLCFQMVGGTVNFIRSAFTKVEHPTKYNYPIYDKLLQSYVKNDLVDYTGLSKSPDLEKAVDELARMSSEQILNDQDKLCYWINAYNLLTLKAICDRYPLKSVKQLGNLPNARKFIVGGKPTTIQNIYLGNLLPALKEKDPRYVFLLCGGAQGYPPLMDHVIEPSRLSSDSQLASYQFVKNAQNVEFNPYSARLDISPFFQWNEPIFEKEYETPFDFVMTYFNEDTKERVTSPAVIKSYAKRFNWRLNDLALKKPASGTMEADSDESAPNANPFGGSTATGQKPSDDTSSSTHKTEVDDLMLSVPVTDAQKQDPPAAEVK